MESVASLEKRAWAGEKLTPEEIGRIRAEMEKHNERVRERQKPNMLINQIANKHSLPAKSLVSNRRFESMGEDGKQLLEYYDQLHERADQIYSELRSVYQSIEDIQEVIIAVLTKESYIAGLRTAIADAERR